MMQSLLINASNLHVGGGVQVATSVIYELVSMKLLPRNVAIWASTEVDENLREIGCRPEEWSGYEVVDTFGVKLFFSSARKRLGKFDVIFTVFGPLYCWPVRAFSIVGFAQAWIVGSTADLYKSMSYFDRIKTRARFALQSFFFRLADQLVVELDHVRDGLVEKSVGKVESIRVVRNCISSLYFKPDAWQPLVVPHVGEGIRIGFVGRNYAHKNTRIFPRIVSALKDVFGIDAKFYVTFTEDEWSACSPEFKSVAVNVGVLSVAQCPQFYSAMDAVIFPSLLECFSATPLEAMAMEKPLFVSDRPFNRDVCGNYAHYFDPMNPDDAAREIAAYLSVPSGSRRSLADARLHAINFSNAKDRARQYLECLIEASQSH